MTKQEREVYIAKPTIAYGGGVEIKDILYDIEDYVVFTEPYLSYAKPIVHKAKIKTTKDGRSYFFVNEQRVYLDECLRADL